MTLKNSYSKSTRVFEDIQKQLRTHGAKQVMLEFTNEQVSAISFGLEIQGRLHNFRLPARVENVEKLFLKQNKRTRTLTREQKEQAYRTAWANIRDWVSAQMALIETEMVRPEEVFMPYLITPAGSTLFDALQERQFNLLEYSNEEYSVEVVG